VSRKEPHTLAGAYAMDALEPLDARRFERHLASCGTCAQEVAELRETAARLGTATALPPPPRMKERVLAQAAQTSQQGPLRAPVRRRVLVSVIAGAAAAAVAAVAVAFGLSSSAANQQLNAAQQRSNQIAAVLTATDATMLSGQVSGGGTARVVMSHHMDELVFTAADLPAVAGYELWLVGPTGHREAAPVDVSGHGMAGPVVAAGLRPGDHLMLMDGRTAVLDMRL
jgi:anti-sigma factor RsiW